MSYADFAFNAFFIFLFVSFGYWFLSAKSFQEKHLRKQNFNFDYHHAFGMVGIAVDLSSGMIGYVRGSKVHKFSGLKILGGGPEYDQKITQEGSIKLANPRLSIFLDDIEFPNIVIPFWSQKGVLQWQVLLGRAKQIALAQSQPDVVAPDLEEGKGAEQNKSDDKTVKTLTQIFREAGYSYVKGKNLKARKQIDAMTEMAYNYFQETIGKVPHKGKMRIAMAIKPFCDYELSSLLKSVGEMIQALESRIKR